MTDANIQCECTRSKRNLIDTETGENGVTEGLDGFVTAVNTDNDAGTSVLSGFDVSGTGPGRDLHLVTISFVAGDTAVSDNIISVEVSRLVDPETEPIGTPHGLNAVLHITEPARGDVNEDGMVDIVDALLIAQTYVGFAPPGFTAPAAIGAAASKWSSPSIRILGRRSCHTSFATSTLESAFRTRCTSPQDVSLGGPKPV